MQNRCDIKKRCILRATLKNDAILQRATKNDAILRRDTKKRCNITSARSQVRGHKNTQISHYLGVIIKSMQNRCDIIKNDAILQRDTKKRCNITARH
jgi:hypothetical protein